MDQYANRNERWVRGMRFVRPAMAGMGAAVDAFVPGWRDYAHRAVTNFRSGFKNAGNLYGAYSLARGINRALYPPQYPPHAHFGRGGQRMNARRRRVPLGRRPKRPFARRRYRRKF